MHACMLDSHSPAWMKQPTVVGIASDWDSKMDCYNVSLGKSDGGYKLVSSIVH